MLPADPGLFQAQLAPCRRAGQPRHLEHRVIASEPDATPVGDLDSMSSGERAKRGEREDGKVEVEAAMTKAGVDTTQGFVCITSRASFEMVQKTIQSGAGALTAVSAPTRLAVDIAQSHNLLLAGQVRCDSFTAYSFPERFMNSALAESTETETHGHQ